MPTVQMTQRAETLRLLAQVARQEAAEIESSTRAYDNLMQAADWMDTKAALLEMGYAEPPTA